MGYGTREVLAAYAAARAAGERVPLGDPTHGDVVRVLERKGYLPRDRARVEAMVARATAAATARVEARRRHEAEQLALPMSGGWWDDPEPVQLTLVLGV